MTTMCMATDISIKIHEDRKMFELSTGEKRRASEKADEVASASASGNVIIEHMTIVEIFSRKRAFSISK